MDQILIQAALVLFIKMEVHHPATVMELETLVPEILTHGGNSVAFGMVMNANQKVTMVFFFTKIALPYCKKKLFSWSRKTFEIRGWRPRIHKNFDIAI